MWIRMKIATRRIASSFSRPGRDENKNRPNSQLFRGELYKEDLASRIFSKVVGCRVRRAPKKPQSKHKPNRHHDHEASEQGSKDCPRHGGTRSAIKDSKCCCRWRISAALHRPPNAAISACRFLEDHVDGAGNAPNGPLRVTSQARTTMNAMVGQLERRSIDRRSPSAQRLATTTSNWPGAIHIYHR